MSKAITTLTPWLRRMLLADPLVTRLGLAHVPGTGRGVTRVEDHAVPHPRPESLSPEQLAIDLVNTAREHANGNAWAGQQRYQVTAYAGDDPEPVGTWPIAVVLDAPRAEFDASSEPSDARGFGSMAARMASDFARLQLQGQQAITGQLVALIERQEAQLEKREAQIEKLYDRVHGVANERMELADARAELKQAAAEIEDDAQTKQALFALVMQAAPVLLSLAEGWMKARLEPGAKPAAPALPAPVEAPAESTPAPAVSARKRAAAPKRTHGKKKAKA